jgi:hypothetical protein
MQTCLKKAMGFFQNTNAFPKTNAFPNNAACSQNRKPDCKFFISQFLPVTKPARPCGARMKLTSKAEVLQKRRFGLRSNHVCALTPDETFALRFSHQLNAQALLPGRLTCPRSLVRRRLLV